jgi:Putative adhesin
MATTTMTMTITSLAVLLLVSQEPYSWREAVPRGHTVEVQGIIGSINATASGGSEVEVVGRRVRGDRGDPAGVEIRVFRESNRIILCAIYPRDSRWDHGDRDESHRNACERARANGPTVRGGNDTRIDFEVRVPAGVNFVGQTVTEGVTLRGLQANAEGYSVAGDVSISEVRGTVVDAASISGDIRIDRVDAAQVYAGTLSGTVSFTGAIKRNGDYDFLSYTGDLRVTLPAGAGVTVRVIAPRRGLHSSVALTPASATSRKRFSGRRGNGSASLSLTTLNGEVIIQDVE